MAADPDLSHARPLPALQLTVDGCQSTLPSAKLATFPRDVNGAVKPGAYVLRPEPQPAYFNAYLKAVNNKLVAVRVEGQEDPTTGEEGITAMPGTPCDQMSLADGVDFYIAEPRRARCRSSPARNCGSRSPSRPTGPPRPIQLALKDNGAWKPLAFR